MLCIGRNRSVSCAAGIAALILSVNPSLTSAQVEGILQQSATDMGTPGYDTEYGWGHVNASAAVNLALPDTVTINEVDPDSVGGVDSAEFVELYDGGVGNTDLSGYDAGSWGPYYASL